MEFLRKYGLFIAAALGIPVLLFLPGLLTYWRYVNVIGIVIAAFLARAELKRTDMRAFARQRLAMLVHVASLLAVSMLSAR